LRVWFEGVASHTIPPGVVLHLLTTATASPGSAAAYLRQNERNVDAALAALEATAQSSRNQENAAAYEAFLKTPSKSRRVILNAVVVIDGASNIENLDAQLRAEIFWAVERKHQDAFLDYLEGWWFRRAIIQLLQIRNGDRIPVAELEAQMSDLREQFKQDALPISDDLLNIALDDAALAGHEDSLFVRQLEIVKANSRRIAAAVRDYYRAFEQRSRWLRDDLLLVGDLANYERKLREEWESVFEAMKDKLGTPAMEAAKVEAARSVLEWAERTSIPIRPAVSEPFITRGSMHILADGLRIGWHPEFRERLAALLIPRSSAS
jgi:quinol monooxygenase YgiN